MNYDRGQYLLLHLSLYLSQTLLSNSGTSIRSLLILRFNSIDICLSSVAPFILGRDVKAFGVASFFEETLWCTKHLICLANN